MATSEKRVTYINLDDDEFEYPMRCRDRGLVYIINNYKFDKSNKLKERPYSHADRDNLIGALKFVGFRDAFIKSFDNLTADDMQRLIEDAGRQDFSRKGCLFVTILTHGDEEKVWGTDRPISYEQLLQPLRVASVRNLKDIPKVLMVQACKHGGAPHDEYKVLRMEQDRLAAHRNRRVTPGAESSRMMETDDDDPQPSDLGHDSNEAGHSLPFYTSPQSDFLVAYSVVPGNREGSPFIQAFCEVMRQHGRRMDAANILANASRIMSYVPGTSMPDKDKAHPCVISQLKKTLYFS